MAKRTNFQMVAAGVCLHDNASLLEPVKTKGVGMKAACSKCGHIWYMNKKIKTCGCLTCRGAKRKSMELAGTNRVGQGGTKKNGGPLWSRTTDLSLIRIDKYAQRTNPYEYIDAWYSEQKLRGLVETTSHSYRRKIEALLGEYSRPLEIDIKRYLSKKQEFGACSGTIANYVKAYRSFFGYLFERGLYKFDPRCLKLPKIRCKERRVPSDEEVAKILNAANSEEDKVALLLLVDTGIRVTELATIKLKNINFDDASIVVNGKVVKREQCIYRNQLLNIYVLTCRR